MDQSVIPIGLIRSFLALIALFFAYYLGRSGARLYQRQEPQSRTVTWGLRTAVALGATVWSGGLDLLSLAALFFTALIAALGVWRQLHPPKEEDLSKEIVPKD